MCHEPRKLPNKRVPALAVSACSEAGLHQLPVCDSPLLGRNVRR
jgi:hypothetical protein